MAIRNLTRPHVDPGSLSLASNSRVLWRCGCGDEFEASVPVAVQVDQFMCRLCRYGVQDAVLLGEFVHNVTHPDMTLSRCLRSSTDLCLWRCRDCGEQWEQTITNRASRRHWNCPLCAKQRGASTRRASQLKKSQEKWAGKLRMLEAIAERLGTANIPNDYMHGEIPLGRWVQSQRDHRKRLDESQIAGLERLPGWSWQRSQRGQTKLADARPDLASQWHPTLNDRAPADVSVGSAYIATWRGCLLDPRHVWTSMVRWRVKSPLIENPCLICSGWQVMTGVSDLATTHPEIAAQWHPTFNDRGADSVGYGSAYRAWWTNCSKDTRHEWQAAVENRTKSGTGCTVCLGKTVMEGINDLATLEPAIAAQWHHELNPKPPTSYSRQSNCVVSWRCENGHIWRAAISTRQNSGCGICSCRILLTGNNDLATLRPEIAAEWDGDRNRLRPDEVLVGSHHRVNWVCPRGHSWQAMVVSRTCARGSGCPACAWKSTSPEQALHSALDNLAHSVKLSASGTLLELRWEPSNVRMKVDVAGVLAAEEKIRVAIEYDGSFYHYGAEREARDLKKTTTLLEAGYVVVRVREQTPKHRLSELPVRHPRLLQLAHLHDRKTPTKPEDMTSLALEIEAWIQHSESELCERRQLPVLPVYLDSQSSFGHDTPAHGTRAGMGSSGRTAAWNAAFERLRTYAGANNTALVPQRFVTEDGFWLGSWVKRQRARRDELGNQQRNQLELLPGWTWAVCV